MEFTLKQYQDEAVRDVLTNIRKARKRWHEEGDRHAFSLTATTGAGKTVMAAAVFEALFYNKNDSDFEADTGAVVIWFSDDPSLNEQTRFRLIEASELLHPTNLVVVENSFVREKFEARKVYFLNTQKLSSKSLLVRGFNSEDRNVRQESLFSETRPDLRAHTIWDTIKNTIDDPSLTLYLVLDEAHRGMGRTSSADQENKTTIVKRLINGLGDIPAIPVVWGISATVERFDTAMKGAKLRTILPNVVVDSTKVQDSGLLKDTIILDVPEGVGQFDTLLVRRATDKIMESSAAWAEYAEQQEGVKQVVPLMVLQIPNTPDHNGIGRSLDTIFERWGALRSNSIAHVLGEHRTQTFGRHQVVYISPERVQESRWVRVLIAKDAVSTGWDCPRAEVMVSFRHAKDRTHITQLLGRMVRTPLARRIPGNDMLNSVNCLLPFFNKKSVEVVADTLMSGGVDDGDTPLVGRQVLINPEEMKPNSSVGEEVWEKYLLLPSQSPPQREANPIKRLTALAQELASDSLLSDAGKKAHTVMHKVLDVFQVQYVDEIAEARKALIKVEGKTLVAELDENTKSFKNFWEEADTLVIEDAYRRAARALSQDIIRTYAEYLAGKKMPSNASKEELLMETHADIAALGSVPGVKQHLDDEAEKLAKTWLGQYRVRIKELSDERKEVYRRIKAMSTEPTDIDLAKPKSWMEPTLKRQADGEVTPLQVYEKHLLCDKSGLFPADLNSWEIKVLEIEMQREGFLAWYRNPSHSSQDSLGVAYTDYDQIKIFRPDFIFFSMHSEKKVVADLVDPHGTHFSDALPKLKGLALYAETHQDVYRRIEAIAKIGEKLRVLDMTDLEVRNEIDVAQDAKKLYESEFASDY